MAIKIDLETAVRLAEEAVASKPEGYVYVNNEGKQAAVDDYGAPAHGCDYFTRDREGSCIVGHVILAAGVPYREAVWNTSVFARTYLTSLEGHGAIEISDDALEFLNDAQYFQDRGIAWDEAVRRAKTKRSL